MGTECDILQHLHKFYPKQFCEILTAELWYSLAN